MIASDLRSGVELLGDMIAEASTIVPFTGAGISTESGIPDFRSPGGLWTRNRPIPFDEFVASPDARQEAWRRRFAMEPTFAAAKPGRGHRALASLYKAGKVPAIVTQNIDNLHQVSGFAADHVTMHTAMSTMILLPVVGFALTFKLPRDHSPFGILSKPAQTQAEPAGSWRER